MIMNSLVSTKILLSNMSKRLSDTEIWKKSWFYDLEQKYKLFWFYILSDCDAAGIWSVNLKLANNILGFKLDPDEIIKTFQEQIAVLNGGKYWLIVDFIKFQYGYPLSESSKMRKKLVELLALRGLNLDTLYEDINSVSIQYQYSINTVKDKDKDKNKGGVGEKYDDLTDGGWNEDIETYNTLKSKYPKLFQLKRPLTYNDNLWLIKKWGEQVVKGVYRDMEAWTKLLKEKEWAAGVADKWCKTETDKANK